MPRTTDMTTLEAVKPINLPAFAAQVRAACRLVPSRGRFGDKVFIHAAWAAGRFAMPLSVFKTHLAECNRFGVLRLSRADLVAAMDPHDVERSNTEHVGAVFNFISAD